VNGGSVIRKAPHEPLLSRPELEATLFAIADIREDVRRIRRLMEMGLGEEDSEDDA
jgi:hypothetical protein